MDMVNAIIAEDDPMVAEINRSYLLKDDRVDTAFVCLDGFCVLDRLREEPAELRLLDIHMPRLNGLELLRYVRGEGVRTDAIFTTAADDWESLGQALRLGAVDYVIKPFGYERFRVALDPFF